LSIRTAATATTNMSTISPVETAPPATFPAPAAPEAPFGIYLHIPFCAHICPYCDFNTYANQSSRIPAYVDALVSELASWSTAFNGRKAQSIFLGGGTPSQLTPAQIATIVRACQSSFDLLPDAEVTIETNPNDLSQPYCAGLLEAGINRISIGAQTLDRKGLRVLGRLHEASQTASAVDSARSAGFTNLSLDLIYGWPGQTIGQWRSDVTRVLAGDVGNSQPDHLSLYSLIVEPGTPMADSVHRGILAPVDDDALADFYELAAAMLADAGWRHYELSNWCVSIDKVSQHNAVYWRNGHYVGAGAGAHGHVSGVRTMNQPAPSRYIDAVLTGRSPITNREEIDPRTAMSETMMLGLRLLEDGVEFQAFADRHDVPLMRQFGPKIEKLGNLGLLSVEPERVRLTSRGALLANDACMEFLQD